MFTAMLETHHLPVHPWLLCAGLLLLILFGIAGLAWTLVYKDGVVVGRDGVLRRLSVQIVDIMQLQEMMGLVQTVNFQCCLACPAQRLRATGVGASCHPASPSTCNICNHAAHVGLLEPSTNKPLKPTWVV